MDTHVDPADCTGTRITEDDEFIRTALEEASIPTLMMSLVHISGDTDILDGEIRPAAPTLGEVQGFLPPEQQAQVRAQALEIIGRYRDQGCPVLPPPPPETVQRMMNFMVGAEVPPEYVPMMLEEMRLDGGDARLTHWQDTVSPEQKQNFKTAVIGAGMSGILSAIRLQEAGIPCVVFEKNSAVGGTWYENTYPGCRVDVANHFYCYSFAPNHRWSEFYAQQGELLQYFEDCVDRFGIREQIRFNTEVLSARYDEQECLWELRVRTAQGAEETVRVNAIISAVGQLNRPKIPDFPGLENFAGSYFHSAEWRHDIDLHGKRVAVIGSGASAFQLVPEVAKQAQKLYVLQRSPPWIFPNPVYHEAVGEGMKWLLEHLPYYARWYRFLLFWPGSDALLPSLVMDEDWYQSHDQRSINQANEDMRIIFTDWMTQQIDGDKELLKKVVPDYPPFCKRILQDNGTWLKTLQRENVQLVCSGLKEVQPNAVVDAEGNSYEVDVIVFATGFHASRFLWPMEVRGRGGVSLEELWGEDPKAYLGITVPDFPNLFCLYGPGTNLAHAGSIIFHSECQVRYILECLGLVIGDGKRALECKTEVNDAFNRKLEKTLEKMIWSLPTDNWYKNSAGRVTATSPWRLADYWKWTRHPDPADYHFE